MRDSKVSLGEVSTALAPRVSTRTNPCSGLVLLPLQSTTAPTVDSEPLLVYKRRNRGSWG